MADIATVILVLATLAVPYWLLRDPRTVPPGRPERISAPSVSVVIPARNEEAILPALLASLHSLAFPVLDVVVVDDGSHDRTTAVARAAGVRVVTAGTPPPRWTGKAWACQTGATDSAGDLILFLDADTTLEPDALDSLLQLRERHGGLVSVQPYHRVLLPYEQLSAYFNAVALMASAAFTVRPVKQPMAFGPCLLTSRDDYVRAGQHAAVRAAILDDVRLAEAYRRAGLPVTCFLGGSSVSMRSYPGGMRQLVSGWTKNIASGAAAASTRASLATVLWVCAHHAIAVGALLALLDSVTGPASPALALWAAAWAVVAWQLRFVLRLAGSFRWWTWTLFPVVLLAFDLIFARSAALTVVRRSVTWRGRRVDLRDNSSEKVA